MHANGGGALQMSMGGPPAPPPGGDAGIKRYLLALLRYKWMILTFTVLGAGAGLVVAHFQKPQYETRSRIWIGTALNGPGGDTGPIRTGTLLQSTGWNQLLQSGQVMDSVVLQQRLYISLGNPADSVLFLDFRLKPRAVWGGYQLALDPSGRGFVFSDAGGAVLQRGAFGDSVGADRGFQWVPQRAAVPGDRPVVFKVDAPPDVAYALTKDVSADIAKDGNFMVLRYRGTDPRRIARTLTAVVERFEQVALDIKKVRLIQQAEILNQQLEAAEASLSSSERALESYKVTTATLPSEQGTPIIPGLSMTDNSAYGNYFAMTKERDQWRRDREAIRAALNGSPSSIVTSLEVIGSVRITSELNNALKEAIASDAKLRQLLADYTEEFRPVRVERARLDSLQQVIIPSMARKLVAELEQREKGQAAVIAGAEKELRQIPARSIQEGKLARAADIDDKLYRNLEERHANAKLAEVTTVPDMEVIDWPASPSRPVIDPRAQTLLMFLGGAFGLGVLLAILRDRMDPRLRYPDQVTAGMGLNILGAVPALRRGRLGASDMALAVEAFRAIQLSLLHTNGNESPVTVTFTSPGASDGKSFVTSNLAIAFADMGHRTLVIDGDVRRGTLHQLMGTTHKPGLTDFLGGQAKRADVIQRTRYPLLDMIGCGSRGEAGPKLLGSPAMADLVESLKPLYDVILIDSPPLGACVDPMILGTLTRNMVMVLRTGTTDRTMAESKLDILDRLPVRVLGAILNDVSASGPYRYYSYMSGYEVVEELPPGETVEAPEAEAAERLQDA